MSPGHSNRLGTNVKLSWRFGIKCCINCTKNVSDKIIVGSGQSRLLTGTGSTIEGNCPYTVGNRVGRSKNWGWGKKYKKWLMTS